MSTIYYYSQFTISIEAYGEKIGTLRIVHYTYVHVPWVSAVQGCPLSDVPLYLSSASPHTVSYYMPGMPTFSQSGSVRTIHVHRHTTILSIKEGLSIKGCYVPAEVRMKDCAFASSTGVRNYKRS